MTREEAIGVLKDWDGYFIGHNSDEVTATLDMAIKALEQELTTKNDLGVDCISRDSAIKALDYDIESFEFKSGVSKHMDDIAKLLNTIYEIQVNNIKALPSLTPQEPKTGHWTEEFNDLEGEVRFTCSSCGKYQLFETDFCYHCGSDNREVEE